MMIIFVLFDSDTSKPFKVSFHKRSNLKCPFLKDLQVKWEAEKIIVMVFLEKHQASAPYIIKLLKKIHIFLISFLDRLEISKSSHSQVFFKIGVVDSFAKFVEKLLYWSLYLTKLYYKRDSSAGVFLWILLKFPEKLY